MTVGGPKGPLVGKPSWEISVYYCCLANFYQLFFYILSHTKTAQNLCLNLFFAVAKVPVFKTLRVIFSIKQIQKFHHFVNLKNLKKKKIFLPKLYKTAEITSVFCFENVTNSKYQTNKYLTYEPTSTVIFLQVICYSILIIYLEI